MIQRINQPETRKHAHLGVLCPFGFNIVLQENKEVVYAKPTSFTLENQGFFFKKSEKAINYPLFCPLSTIKYVTIRFGSEHDMPFLEQSFSFLTVNSIACAIFFRAIAPTTS